MGIFHHSLFREAILLAAIILLGVYCIDKSRQNQRTRNTLYNCIYILYGAAVAKTVQMVGYVWQFGMLRETMGLLLTIGATWGYAKWFKPQLDIPYNKWFRMVGWGVMVMLVLVQVCMVLLSCWRR